MSPLDDKVDNEEVHSSPAIHQDLQSFPPLTQHALVDTSRLLSEQSALDRISVRRQAVGLLEAALNRSLPELDIDSEGKTTVWAKLVGGMSAKQKKLKGGVLVFNWNVGT